jgi:hypothetical protein
MTHFTKLIREEYIPPGRPLVIMLSLAEEDLTKKEVGYLIDALRTSASLILILPHNVYLLFNRNKGQTPKRSVPV